MSYVHTAHRAAPVISVRPPIAPYRPVTHRPVAPRILPILQAPTFPIQSNFISEDIESDDQQQLPQNVKHSDTTIVDHTHGRKIPQKISVRVPTHIPQQNYPKQPLLILLTQPIRHAERKYPTDLYTFQ